MGYKDRKLLIASLVFFQIVANNDSFGDLYVLVNNSATDTAMAPDFNVIEENAVAH